MPGIGSAIGMQGAVSGSLGVGGRPKIDSQSPPPMKTLVYNPAARIIIARGNRQYDVSSDLVNGGVVRPIDAAASLQFTLNNRDLRYNGLFDRMDRVILFLKRIKTIQVFSGYLDDCPYLQLYPGTVTFRATCTMKRLKYTWWDPSLAESMALFGTGSGNPSTQVQGDGTTVPGVKPIGSILRDVLVNVGGWDQDKIIIENFPMKFMNLVRNWQAQNMAHDEGKVQAFLQQLLGDDHSMGGGASASANPALTLGPQVIGAPNYIATMINICDQLGWGPNTNDMQHAQQMQQAAAAGQSNTPGAASASTAFKGIETAAQSWQGTYRNSDAAILALACAMGENPPVPRVMANSAVEGSEQILHDGIATSGTGVGLYNQTTGGQWGDVAQRMNPEASTRAFYMALGRIDWRNMDPAAAIQAVQGSAIPGKYAPYIQPATAAIQAARGPATDIGAALGSTATANNPLSPAGLISTGQAAAGLLPSVGTTPGGTNPNSLSALAGAAKPNPDAMSAIVAGMSYIGSPYDQIRPPVRGRGVDCIAEGTLIATARGDIPIESLTTEDMVLTRRGYRRVLRAWKVRDDAPVAELRRDGHVLRGTPDHRVWTENRGWVPLGKVTSVDTLVLCPTQRSEFVFDAAQNIEAALRANIAHGNAPMRPIAPGAARRSSSRGSRTTATPNPTGHRTGHISRTLATDPCTSPSGDITMGEISRRGMKCTMSTTTPSTTTRLTWHWSSSPSTGEKARLIDVFMSTCAPNAGASSRHTGPARASVGSVVENTSKTTTIVGTTNVYDITVEGDPEFFANGILVHNCSGLTSLAYKSIGIDIGGNTYSQLAQLRGRETTPDRLQPGDLIFPHEGHTFMWLGNAGVPGGPNMILESSGSGWTGNGPSPDGPRVKVNHYNMSSMLAMFHVADFGGWDPSVKFNEPALMGPGYAPGSFGTATSGTGSSAGGGSTEPIARNLFTYQFNYPAYAPKIAALFDGERSLINCEPLINVVQMLCKATMRSWCSSPKGDFVAWYPDYFGLEGKQAVMRLEDIELKDVTINLNDYSLITHAYVAAQTSGGGEPISPLGWLQSGVATVENENLFQQMARISPQLGEEAMTGRDILTRFGARPFLQEYTMVASPELRQLLAIHHFMQGWANQFSSNAQFCFLPELFPGMRIEFVGHNLQVYVTQVEHSFDYQNGFKTYATITAPSVPRGVQSQLNQLQSLSPAVLLEKASELLSMIGMG